MSKTVPPLVEIKTTIRISDALLNRFKHLAIDKNTTINNLIITSMEDYLRRLDSKTNGKK